MEVRERVGVCVCVMSVIYNVRVCLEEREMEFVQKTEREIVCN